MMLAPGFIPPPPPLTVAQRAYDENIRDARTSQHRGYFITCGQRLDCDLYYSFFADRGGRRTFFGRTRDEAEGFAVGFIDEFLYRVIECDK